MKRANSKTKPDLNELLIGFEQLVLEFPYLIHCFRIGLGAVYALKQARKHRHRERRTWRQADVSKLLPETLLMINQIRSDTAEGTWLAGFYFNAALMRIDAFYERSLRCLITECQDENQTIPELKGKNGKKAKDASADELAKVIRRRFLRYPGVADFERSSLGQVRREVIRLKHFCLGQPPENSVTQEVAARALKDLLVLLHCKPIQEFLRVTYGGKAPTP
jgi:hypothetical protein